MTRGDNAHESAMLILQRGGEAGVVWQLARGTLTIGRSAECDIVLDDRQVSRQHARVAWREDHYEIEDLGSKNGTHLNGREVTGVKRLRDGDEIQIALGFKLAFVDAGATAPLTFETPVKSGLRMDPSGRQIWVNGRQLDPPLSPQQFRLLELLMNASGAVGREVLVRAVWADAAESGVSEQSIDALVRRLRERLGELDPEHQYVVTMRGFGFRFDNRPG